MSTIFPKRVERRIIITSRLADGYVLTGVGMKNLQHVFTVWFPRAIYNDLTDDTVKVDVTVRMGRSSGKSVYNVVFVRGDGGVIKRVDYDEDRLVGRVCECYEQSRSGYYGRKDGVDFRIVSYLVAAPGPITLGGR